MYWSNGMFSTNALKTTKNNIVRFISIAQILSIIAVGVETYNLST